MKQKVLLWSKEEYLYPGAGQFIPYLMADIHEDERIRPAMIVVPGGGFIQLCTGEAEGVTKAFYDLGYNTFVLVYTNNVTLRQPVYYQALKDASRAVRILRKRCDEFCINPDQIHAIGFSGGGTLVASMATRYALPILQDSGHYKMESNRLNSASLVYPMTRANVSQGISNILVSGETPELLQLDQCVDQHTVPLFILHGTEDCMVAAEEQAIPMAMACARNKIPYELHLLLGCDHGFIVQEMDPEGPKNSEYLFDQLYCTINAMTDAEFADYADVYGELKKDMEFCDFAQIVQKETMNKMWWKGLQVDPAQANAAVRATTTGEMRSELPANPSAKNWWLMVDHWIKMLFPNQELVEPLE